MLLTGPEKHWHYWLKRRLPRSCGSGSGPLGRRWVIQLGISDKEPTDLKKGPVIPADAKWKFRGSLFVVYPTQPPEIGFFDMPTPHFEPLIACFEPLIA